MELHKSDKYKFVTMVPPSPYNFDYVAIDYGTWMQNGSVRENPKAMWPDNPYQYVFGDRIVSQALMNSVEIYDIDIVKKFRYRVFKPNEIAGNNNAIWRNSKHCGKSIVDEGKVCNSYGIITKEIDVECEIRLFWINGEIFVEVLEGEWNDTHNLTLLFRYILEQLSNVSSLNIFAVDFINDGFCYYLNDFNTFPGTLDQDICKKIGVFFLTWLNDKCK